MAKAKWSWADVKSAARPTRADLEKDLAKTRSALAAMKDKAAAAETRAKAAEEALSLRTDEATQLRARVAKLEAERDELFARASQPAEPEPETGRGAGLPPIREQTRLWLTQLARTRGRSLAVLAASVLDDVAEDDIEAHGLVVKRMGRPKAKRIYA